MKKILIGLDRYQLFFKTKKEQQEWINKNRAGWMIEEIFINNGYGLEIKKKRKVA